MLFTNKSPLKTYYYYAPLQSEMRETVFRFINNLFLLTPGPAPLVHIMYYYYSQLQSEMRETVCLFINKLLLTSYLYP